MINRNDDHAILTSGAELAFRQAAANVIARAKETNTPIITGMSGNIVVTPTENLRDDPWENALVQKHRHWLSNFDSSFAREWERLLCNNIESALAEADAREMLQSYGLFVAPNRDVNSAGRSPDFKCSRGNFNFYVEVACLTCETAARKTGLEVVQRQATCYEPPIASIQRICKSKATQCEGMQFPVLLMIGTLHSSVAVTYFQKTTLVDALVGNTGVGWDLDGQGRLAGASYNTTNVGGAAFFMRQDSGSVRFARSSVSGLLFWGISMNIPVLGVLHPNAARPFDPAILPGIEFGKGELDPNSKQITVTWPNESGTDSKTYTIVDKPMILPPER